MAKKYNKKILNSKFKKKKYHITTSHIKKKKNQQNFCL